MEDLQESQYYYWFIDSNGDKWLLCNISGRGKGDLIFRMAFYALVTGDVKVIKACIRLLNERKRWPDDLNEDQDAKTWIGRIINMAINKLFGSKLPFRYQGQMSRDPYIMLYCAIFWHQYEMIRDLKPAPWYLQAHAFKFWVKYLIENEPEYKTRFEKTMIRGFSTMQAFGFKAYVKSLSAWMVWIARSESVKAELLPFIPEWNLVNLMLCGYEIESFESINAYKSREGWYWNSETNYNDRFLGPNEPVYLDKLVLEFVFENQNWK